MDRETDHPRAAIDSCIATEDRHVTDAVYMRILLQPMESSFCFKPSK